MKIFVPVLAILLLIGCAEDEIAPKELTNTNESPNTLIFDSDTDLPGWKFTTLNEEQSIEEHSAAVSLRTNSGNSVHAHGEFTTFVFSGTENNGGVHGSASGSLGPLAVTMETECVMVEDSVAVYGGIITTLEGPTPPGFPFGPGDLMYFRVIDNGQGANAPADQFTGAIRFKGSCCSRCGIWTPSHPSWSNFGEFDVNDPGSIKVND